MNMPIVTSPSRLDENGQSRTYFVDTVGTTSTTYTYLTQQDALTVSHRGTSTITLTVNGVTYTIQGSGVQTVSGPLISFSLVSTSLTSFNAMTITETTYMTEKASLKSSGFPFPPDLIAFWDFIEPKAPYYSKAGVDKFPLNVGGTDPIKVSSAPFGSGLLFNGSSTYLTIPSSNVGALNVGKSGEEVTVLSWVTRTSASPVSDGNGRFIAGMWQEDNGNPKRQYGLFANLPTYGGQLQVCGHISKTGGASPNIPFSRDYSSTGTLIGRDITRCIGFTYNGIEIRSYLDGIADLRPTYTEPGAPNGQGLTYAKNPYAFDLGLNRSTIADFTVGSVKLTSGWGNFFDGVISGLAVFRRALTPAEMMKIYLDSLQIGNPVQQFDFMITGISTKFLIDHGWETARGATATDTSNNAISWALTRLTALTNKSFLYRSNNGGEGNETSYAIAIKTGLNSIRLGQIGRVEFTMNNKAAGDAVRFCIKVGGQWYATSSEYDSGAVGVSGADWSTGILKSLTIVRDKTQWLTLNYTLGTTLSLGTQPAIDLPNSEVTGVGFLSKPIPIGGIVRIADLKLFSS